MGRRDRGDQQQRGIRLMRDGDISTVDKSRIGESLAMALKQKVENPLARKWYRRRLVEAYREEERRHVAS